MPDLVDFMQHPYLWRFVELMAAFFIFVIGITILVIIVLYVIDKTQTKHAIRRNFPVIGRFRSSTDLHPVQFVRVGLGADRRQVIGLY